MRRLWHRWVDRCQRPLDTRVYALVRVLIALCVLADLLQVALRGLVVDLFTVYAHGGMSGFHSKDYVLDALLGPSGGLWAYGTTLVCMVMALLGVATRPAILLGVLAYGQLGALFPPGDRVIDHLLRTVLLVLMFSGSHTRWSLGRWLRGRSAQLSSAAWPADLVRWLLVMV